MIDVTLNKVEDGVKEEENAAMLEETLSSAGAGWFVLPLAGFLVAAGLVVILLMLDSAIGRVERELMSVREGLDRVGRNVDLTLQLAESSRLRAATEPGEKVGAEGRQFTEFVGARDELVRWLEGGQRLLPRLAGLLDEHDRLRADLEASGRQLAQLRDQLGRLRDETEYLLQERAEIARQLSKIVNDVRLPHRQA